MGRFTPRQPFSFYPGVSYVCARAFHYDGRKYVPGDAIDTKRLRERQARQYWDQRKIDLAEVGGEGFHPLDRDRNGEPGGELPEGYHFDADGAVRDPFGVVVALSGADFHPPEYELDDAPGVEGADKAENPAAGADDAPAGTDEPEPAAPAPEAVQFALPFAASDHKGFGRYFVVDANGANVSGPWKKDEVDAKVAEATAEASKA